MPSVCCAQSSPRSAARRIADGLKTHIKQKLFEGPFAAAVGQPTITTDYLLCFAYEQDDALEDQKIRAVLVQKEGLLNGSLDRDLKHSAEDPDKPMHRVRAKTLTKIREIYQSGDWQGKLIEFPITIRDFT